MCANPLASTAMVGKPQKSPNQTDSQAHAPAFEAEWSVSTVDGDDWTGQQSSIQMADDGSVHIAYMGNGGTNEWGGLMTSLSYATNAGGDFVTEVIDTPFEFTRFANPSMTLAADGSLHVLYTMIDDAWGAAELRYANNRFGFWMWEPVHFSWSYSPDVTVDDLGTVHATWYSDGDLWYGRNDGFGWFTEPIANGQDFGTSVAVDAGGVIHVTYWILFPDADLGHAWNDGGGWQTEVIDASEDEDTGNWSSLAVDAGGNLHVVHSDWTDRELQYTTNASGAWVTTVADADVENGLPNTLVIGSDGDLHVLYGGGRFIKYATFDGADWLVRNVVGGDVFSPSLDLDALDAANISFGFGWPSNLQHATLGDGDGIDQNCDGVDG